jgi:gamma-glutamylcyclotransferase (GGCT)/AIG2-like uncharacterized protein YtfP
MSKLFVYGTLMTGKGKKDHVGGYLWDLGAFPALTTLNGTAIQVPGEVIEVTPTELANYDIYEGVPHLYRREKTKTFTGEEVWVYVWASDTLPPTAKVIDSWKNT